MNDYARMSTPDTLQIERLLPAPIERVWAYLSEPELRAQWLAGGSSTLTPGSELTLVFHNNELTTNDDPAPAKYTREAGPVSLRCRILECRPPELLVFTWGLDEEASVVRFELSIAGTQTRLRVTHARLLGRGIQLSVSAGWHAHLDILCARMAGKEPEGFWRSHTRLEAEYAGRLPETVTP